MKIIIASDIHGSAIQAKKLKEAVDKERPDKLVLLGDYLYHGPRNSFPEEYDSASVYEILNSMKNIIVAVRGNCDSEVDQMVLEFPIIDDYKTMKVDGYTWYLTHGHVNSLLPEMGERDILFNGHTHIYEISENKINPGSIGLPKVNKECTYILYENGKFSLYSTDGNKLNA